MTAVQRRLERQTLRPMLLAVAVAGIGATPVFLLGGLAVLIRSDLGFSEVRLGVAVATFFGFAALGAVPAGVISDRIGYRGAVIGGLGGSVCALLVTSVAQAWWQLVTAMAIAGLAHAVLQVAANLLLAGRVPVHNQGLAFGVKQSAVPAAIMLTGISLPVIAVAYGWRAVYLIAIVMALVGLLSQARRAPAGQPRRPSHEAAGLVSSPRRALVMLSIGGGVGAGAANGLGAFIVEFAVHSGFSVGGAGVMLSVSSFAGVLSRVVAGWLADRHGGADLLVMAAMLMVGAGAFAVMPVASVSLVWLTAAGILAFGAGWGWPGLINYIVVRYNPQAPAAATGITHAGIYVGGVIGPIAMGWAVSTFSYTVAWWGAGSSVAVASLMTLAARRGIHGAPLRGHRAPRG